MTQNSINNKASAFNADSITFDGGSNLLNKYEQGTFTPQLNFGGVSIGMDGIFNGNYTSIGRIVHIGFHIELITKGSSTGDAGISGLPFIAGISSRLSVARYSLLTYLPGRDSVFFNILSGSSGGLLQMSGSGIGVATLTDVQFTDTTRIFFQGYYIV